jgi:hypothetical protein
MIAQAFMLVGIEGLAMTIAMKDVLKLLGLPPICAST